MKNKQLVSGIALLILVVAVAVGTNMRSGSIKGDRAQQASKPSSSGKFGQKVDSPNILIITMDTTRADHLGCYGYEGVKTPAIDEVASEGVVFENAFSVQPVTLPSHCSIFTGQYPFRHGVRDNSIYRLSDRSITLAEILHARGYLTTAFISSYILDHQFGLAQGFEYYNDRFVKPKQKGRLPVDRRASEVSFLACDWLDAVKSRIQEKPFFLWLHYYDPHADYDPPHPYRGAYPNLYDGEIAYMDDWIGYFFNCLKKRGLWENTLVIMTADHGESLGEYNERTHGIFMYHSTTQVPLIIRHPELIKQGVRVRERVSSVDILPTVLDILGIGVEMETDGRSLLGYINGNRDPERAVYSEAFIPKGFGWSELKGVRQRDRLYIEAPKKEFYHIALDAGARENVIEKEAAAAQNMGSLLESMLASATQTYAEKVSVDSEMVQKLRAIGYFAGGGEAEESDGDQKDRPDPKDRIHLFNFYQRANSLIANGSYEAGTALLEKIVEQDPGNTRFRMELGDALVEQDRFQDAEKHLKKCISIKPQDARIHFLLGNCYEKWGKGDRAEKEYQATIALNPQHFMAHFHLGILHINAKRWEEARQAFTRTRQLKPRDPRTLNNLGYIAIKAENDFRTGIDYIRQALDAAPKNHEIMGSLGSAYLNSGDYEKARRYLEGALEIVPDSQVFIQELMRLYTATGEKDRLEQLQKRQALIERNNDNH